MAVAEIPQGGCLAFGGTNARRANWVDGDITGFEFVPTPRTPKAFMGWMARQVLDFAEEGAEWVVAGFPGPVDGMLVGPMVNVHGMKKRRFGLNSELSAADPAVGRLLSRGRFSIIPTNDGPLAAHAAAQQKAESHHKTVAALINGTGLGTGIVTRDIFKSEIFHSLEMPFEIGHLIMRGYEATDTYENLISGSALDKKYGSPKDIPTEHIIWQSIGLGMGKLATMLGLTAGADLVVPTGGIGAKASDKYKHHLEDFLVRYEADGNIAQKLFIPEIITIDPKEADAFELYGAGGAARDYLTR